MRGVTTWFIVLTGDDSRVVRSAAGGAAGQVGSVTPGGSGVESVAQGGSGVKLVTQGGSGVKLVTPEDSGAKLVTRENSGVKSVTPEDSGVKLVTPEDSGVKLVTRENSGVKSVAPEDSGVKSVAPKDSGVKSVALGETEVKSVVPSARCVLRPSALDFVRAAAPPGDQKRRAGTDGDRQEAPGQRITRLQARASQDGLAARLRNCRAKQSADRQPGHLNDRTNVMDR